jgi:hypothetical protein
MTQTGTLIVRMLALEFVCDWTIRQFTHRVGVDRVVPDSQT